ncbi:phospholipid methyltransferase [Aureococcus anophagefferens]|nr:phospholipid methyltransferase [Aureococcus anophagefferens]
MAPFAAVEPKFAAYHLSSMNVNFHLLTSCPGALGAAGRHEARLRGVDVARVWGRQSLARGGAFGLWVLWGLALLCSDAPARGRERGRAASVAIVASPPTRRRRVLGCVAAGYALQDLSHWYYGEETLQANSWAGSSTLRYMSTHYAKGVAFGTFKRDVLFFKTVALLQLFRLYAAPLWDGKSARPASSAARPRFDVADAPGPNDAQAAKAAAQRSAASGLVAAGTSSSERPAAR